MQRFETKHTNFCTDDLGWGSVIESSVFVLTDKLYDFVLRSHSEEREMVKDQLKYDQGSLIPGFNKEKLMKQLLDCELRQKPFGMRRT